MLAYIISGAVALILLVILIRFSPFFRLLFIRFKHGKYSSRYIAMHKRLFVKSPFPYCIKDELDYRIVMFLEMKDRVKIFDTKAGIQFGDIPFHSSLKTIMTSRGEMMCFNAVMHPGMKKELKVAGYRESILSIDMKALYYILADHFFMGEYVFKEINAQGKDKLVDLLVKKYDLNSSPSEIPFIIRDKEGRMIMFSDTGFSIQIAYIDLNHGETGVMINQYFMQLRSIKPEHLPGVDEDLLGKL